MAKVSVNISREPGGVSRFRELLPQIIASVACNFVLLDLNSCLGYPTVIIAQLRETQEIPLSKSHASWLGSIAYICQPFGSLSSGFLVEWLGRRRFMMLLNIPFLTGWLLMCFAPSFPVLVLASVIIGITIGLTEAPINSYIGEVCQPEIRGMMTACAGVFYQCGFFVEYLLGSLTTWRNTAGISAAIPIFTAIYIFLVPEAPIWLVSKGRIEEAEKALCWLRGWVDPSVVKEELTELVRYHEETNKLLGSQSTRTQVGFSNPAFVEENRTDGKTMPIVTNAESQDVNSQSWGGEMMDRLRDLIRPPTLRPLMLVIPFFFFVHFSGLTSIRPFMVEVFKKFDMPISGEWAAVLASSANNFFRMNVSLSLGFATVVIAQLHNAEDPLSLDDTSASWLGSIAYICQPLGSVASGVIVELIGRKKFLIALNIPFLIGLILLCTAPSYAILLLANVIIGITVGLTEAPNNSYNGEVCQPELRGAMSANSGIFYQLGFFMQFLLGSLTHWRTAAAISTVIPIATLICVSLIPEVPIWLISRGRHLEAEKALRWLRGWVSPNAVQKELSELVRYHDDTKLGKKKTKDSSLPSNQNDNVQSQSTNTTPEITDTITNQSEIIVPKITNNENQSDTCSTSSEAVKGVNNQTGGGISTQHNQINASERNIPMSEEETASGLRSHSQNQTVVPKIVINDEETCSPLDVNNTRSYILPAIKGEVTLNKELSASMIRNEAMSNYNRNLTIANTTFAPEKVEQTSSEEKESAEPTGFQVVGVVRDLFRPPTLRPLLLVVPFFFFVHFAGLTSIRPYMVLVFRELQMPISAEWFTVVSGGCGLLGSILLMVFVRLLGKRLISLVGTALSAGAVLLLGVYTYIRPEDETGTLTSTWIPLVLIVTLSFCNSIVEQIPSILISEVYPFRTRGLSVGISVAFCYFFIFLATKTYLDIEKLMSLYGAFWLYGIISCIGYIFFHYFLMETEGKTLEGIEQHFTQGISARSKIGRKKGKKEAIMSTHL